MKKLSDLIKWIDAEILTGVAARDAEIETVYAGDRISDLLSQGREGTLLVTNLTGVHLLRVAELMDVPALCLLGDVFPEAELTQAAKSRGTVLLVSRFGMFETCGRLYQRLAITDEGQP